MAASASSLIADVRSVFAGDPVYMAGSLVAEHIYGKSDAHSDVDLFCPTFNMLMCAAQKLQSLGYTLDERNDRVLYRWKRYGNMNKWHTNTLRLMDPTDTVEVNLTYKLVDGHATTSLAQVIESFDFGLLGAGYDLEVNQFQDMRGYLFPGMDPMGPLPMMPAKRENWRRGFISQYNGIRETDRYVKYWKRGYDLSLVKDDLVTGYLASAAHNENHFKPEMQTLGKIYSVIANYIDGNDIDGLAEAAKEIDYSDELDAILEKLE